MEQSILYFDNETQSLYFGGQDEYNITNNKIIDDNNFLVITIYLLGFYHLSWYIINSFRKFRHEELNKRLGDCRVIFRILNENFEMFNKNSVEIMNTTELLENTLDFFEEDCSSHKDSDEESVEDTHSNDDIEDSDEESIEDTHSNDDIEAAKTLTSMGKNWIFDQ